MMDKSYQFNHRFDPKDPETEEIILKRKIRDSWLSKVEKILRKEQPADFSHHAHLINLRSIWSAYSVFPQEKAKYPNPDTFILLLQDTAIQVMERRHLYFNREDVFSLADPDHAGENPYMLASHGIITVGEYGYEMDLPVILNKDLDGKDFNLFFALHWSNLDFTESTEFFDFHLKHTSHNDLGVFSSYMRQVLWQYESLKLGSPQWNNYFEKVLLTGNHAKAFDDWLSNKAIMNSGEAKMSKATADSFIPPNDLEPAMLQFRQAAVMEALYKTLAPYFDEEELPALNLRLEGKDTGQILHFRGNAKRLVTIFLKVDSMNLFISSKAEIQRWITKNLEFRHPKTKTFQKFDPGYVYGILTFQHEVKRDVATPFLDKLNR